MRSGKIISSSHDFIQLHDGYDEDEFYEREELYKAFIQNKELIKTTKETQTRVTTMESTSKEMLDLAANGRDNIDTFIDEYVEKNADLLLKIANK